jgi:hypothetical protein
MSKVNLEMKLSQFSEHWAPRTVAQFNGHDIMVVKSKGEFVWHSHPDTDDFFLVLKMIGRRGSSPCSRSLTRSSGRVPVGGEGSSAERPRAAAPQRRAIG